MLKEKTAIQEFYIKQNDSSKLRRGKGQEVGSQHISVQNCTEVFLAGAIKQEKKKETNWNWSVELLFSDNQIFGIENIKGFRKKNT